MSLFLIVWGLVGVVFMVCAFILVLASLHRGSDDDDRRRRDFYIPPAPEQPQDLRPVRYRPVGPIPWVEREIEHKQAADELLREFAARHGEKLQ